MAKRFNIKNKFLFAVVATAIILRLASEPAAIISYLVIAVYALSGRAQAIQALALSWLLTMINPGLAPEAPYAFVMRYVVLLAAAISVFLRSNFLLYFKLTNNMVRATLMLGSFLIVLSYFFSPMIGVSVLKALSWTVSMSTLFAAWGGLSPESRDLLARLLFQGIIFVMLASLPLLLVPSLGYLRNGTGFQGILNHPQVFGLTMALLGARAASHILAYKRPPWSNVVLVAASVMLVFLSQARTAGMAMVLGVGVAIVIAPFLAKRPIRSMLPGLRSKRVHIILGLTLACFLIAGPTLNAIIRPYISKGTGVTHLIETYENSRGILIEPMWYNIKDKPLQGIGFGIASVPALMNIERDPVFELPISASVEKGAMPLAVLEELGIFGFLAVAAWLWILLRRSAHGGVGPLAVSITVLLMNMGEATLFSPGGMGLLILILLGWAAQSGNPKRQASGPSLRVIGFKRAPRAVSSLNYKSRVA